MDLTWTPKLTSVEAPRYLAIVAAIEKDIAEDILQPGTRLPPQRALAEKLGLSVGTVLKAYAEAERRGLVSGEVGRGTFVRQLPQESVRTRSARDQISLWLNVPPPVGEAPIIAEAITVVTASPEFESLLNYWPHPGLPAHRNAISRWLVSQGAEASADRLILCNGGRQSISVALSVIAKPGDTILTEPVTYPGIVVVGETSGYKLHGVAIDEQGIRPDALDAAFSRTGARVLYCMPTLQTPTGAVMSKARREEIVRVVRQHKATVIEDDVFSFLHPSPPPTLQSLLPEQVFYITSFTKCASGGLRIGALLCPEWARERTALAFRYSMWVATPIMAAVAAHLIESKRIDELVRRRRSETTARWDIAREKLGADRVSAPVPSFQIWLPLTIPIADVVSAAAINGVILAPPYSVSGDPVPQGLRICIGSPETREELVTALNALALVLNDGNRYSIT